MDVTTLLGAFLVLLGTYFFLRPHRARSWRRMDQVADSPEPERYELIGTRVISLLAIALGVYGAVIL